MEKAFNHKYIVVEGPIGVGKTSLVDLIGQEFRFKQILEVVEENPFLPKFYKEMKNFAFQTQIFFLLNRYKQQQALFQNELFSSGIMADYLFEKDRIFAYVNLDESELVLYEKLYAILKPQVPKPDLVIYLQANTDTLIKRIKMRGRTYEKTIGHDYLDRLNKAYNEFFLRYKETPLLIINTNEIDFVHKMGDLNDLIKTIREMKTGTKYYLPISS
ncbi:MAG: deoxyadenosine kinase [Candidatus Firestonebacteria bacterium RIFOXYC2_FULL_39_67]|nr:MAG: deoxyadenosine kinase [Candidatus Firestonebacteria bacterium RIFOXYD2_FULL_39_29]OGF53955.1 MAG: deoxyadenosine kinase [Candidatus Firestonebacteria bacterium RIFOXYC2_FULL_39_67]